MLHGQLPFVSHPGLFFCIEFMGCLGISCIAVRTHFSSKMDLISRHAVCNSTLACVLCLYCQLSEQMSQKKIKQSHVEYGHVHNALSRHHKDGQMVANVQESTSANINLDVIACTKQSADTPA